MLAVGNTEEYATTYPGTASKPEILGYCNYIIPDAFDVLQMEAKDQPNVFSEITSMVPYPLNLVMSWMGFGEVKDMHDKDGDDSDSDDDDDSSSS